LLASDSAIIEAVASAKIGAKIYTFSRKKGFVMHEGRKIVASIIFGCTMLSPLAVLAEPVQAGGAGLESIGTLSTDSRRGFPHFKRRSR